MDPMYLLPIFTISISMCFISYFIGWERGSAVQSKICDEMNKAQRDYEMERRIRRFTEKTKE